MLKKMSMLLGIYLLVAGATLARAEEAKPAEVSQGEKTAAQVGAKDADLQIPDQVPADNWAYRRIAELVKKYQAETKLPEGNSCSKQQLAVRLLSVMDKIVKAYEKEGKPALVRDDLQAVALLHSSLQADLEQQDEYRTIRGTIREILTQVEPEVPDFEYKIGVNGFLRLDGARNFRLTELSYAPGHDAGRLLYRVKPYAYWHPTDYLDFHLEGQGYGYTGENDFHRASLYQGYVEARIPEQKWLALKAGRQEFVYGSAFILGADAAFDGLTYDAGRIRLRPTDTVTLDILGGRYAEPFSKGVKGNLVGAYLSYAPNEDTSLEGYWVRDAGSEEHHAGEYLDILGLRSTGKLGRLCYEIEPVYETGKLFNPDTGSNQTVRAFGGHIDLSAEFQPLGFKNKFLAGYAVGTGDRNPAKEFRTPGNDTSLVGDMHVVGDLSGLDVGDHHASGMHIYTLGWGIDLTEQLNFSATAHKFVAIAVEDGFSKHLGVEGDFSLTYAFNKDFSLILAYDRFFTEGFFRDASGSSKGIDYAYAMLTFNFDKKKVKIPKM
jgi:hypothetical protein